jgi:hypothetical protein
MIIATSSLDCAKYFLRGFIIWQHDWELKDVDIVEFPPHREAVAERLRVEVHLAQ